jgi:hypothetical protein
LSVVLTGTGIWLWGFLLAFLIRMQSGDSRPLHIIKGISLAPITGPGLLSVAWFFALYLECPQYLIWFFLGLSAFLFVMSRWLAKKSLDAHETKSVSKWVVLPVLTGIIMTSISLYLDQSRPNGGSDAMAIWNYAARFLFRSGVNYPELMPLLHPSHHMDYPLFIPGAVSAQWFLLGRESWDIIQWTHAGFILPFACLGYEIVSAVRSPRLAALTSTAMMLTPALLIWNQRQYVDPHVAYALLGGVGGLGLALHKKNMPPSHALCTGLYLGAMPWLKNEGIPLLILATSLFVFFLYRQDQLRVRRSFLIQACTGMLLFLGALVVFKQSWPPTNDLLANGGTTLFDYFTNGSRWHQVLAAYGGEFNPYVPLTRTRWGASLLLIAILVFLSCIKRSWRDGSMNQMFMLFIAFASSGWIVVYVLTPQELGWHLTTSMNRLILQLQPAFLVICVICATSRRHSFTQKTATSS